MNPLIALPIRWNVYCARKMKSAPSPTIKIDGFQAALPAEPALTSSLLGRKPLNSGGNNASIHRFSASWMEDSYPNAPNYPVLHTCSYPGPAGMRKQQSSKTSQPQRQLDRDPAENGWSDGVFFYNLAHRGGRHRTECFQPTFN